MPVRRSASPNPLRNTILYSTFELDSFNNGLLLPLLGQK